MRDLILKLGLTSLMSLTLAQSEVPVEVVSYTLRESATGSLYVVGEVRNTHANPLCFVQITIEYLDEKGNPIGVDRFTAKDAGTMTVDQVSAPRDVIPPGETSPFERVRDVSKVKGKVHRCKVTAAGLRLRESNVSATVTDVQITPQGEAFAIKGTYKATGKAPCKSPAIIAAGYDKNGKILGVTRFYLTSDGTTRGTPVKEIQAEQSQGFSFPLSKGGQAVQTVRVFPSHECD